MNKASIRTDKWKLDVTVEQKRDLEHTIALYRAFVRACIGVIFVHWPDIASATRADF